MKMTQSDFEKKLQQVKYLQGKTVLDLIMTDDYLKMLASFLKQQKELRKKVQAVWKGHAPAHTVDKFMEYTSEQFRDAYILVLDKTSKLPATQRLYVQQLGGLAYRQLVKNVAIAEFPELKEYYNGQNS